MTKKILLLFAKDAAESGAANPARLAELLNATDTDVEVSTGFFEDAEYALTPEHVGIRMNDVALESYDIVYFRYWGTPSAQSHALAMARYCRLLDIPYVDSEVFRQGSFNKINQYLNLFEAGVPFPATVICHASRITTLAEHYLSFPLVAKDARGTRGSTNFLVEDMAQLEDIKAQHPQTTFVLQQYIQNDGDYRVFVTGDQVGLLIHRQAQPGAYLNNTSQGGTASLVATDTVPQAMLDDAVKAAAFFGRDIAGVDMVLDAEGNHYCFEVNRAPQIEGSSFEAEKAAAVANYLHRRACHQ